MTRQPININDDNIEQYIFLYKEGMLNDTERTSVEEMLAVHKEWQELAEMYDPALQVPDYPKLTYSDKDKLKAIAKPSKKRVKVIALWSRMAAAIAIIFAVVLFIRINNSGNNNSNDHIVASTHINKKANAVTKQTHTEPYQTEAIASPKTNTKRVSHPQTLTAKKSGNTIIEEPTLRNTADLITYVDDNDSAYDYLLHEEEPILEYTQSLVIFVDDDTEHQQEQTYYAQNQQSALPKRINPELRATIDDWFTNLQVARLEFHANMVTNLCKLVSTEE